MPITDRAKSAVLSSLDEGEWVELSAIPTPVEDGFDTLDVDWLCDFRAEGVTAQSILAEHFPQGQRYGDKDFWLRQATPQRVGGNVWRVAASYAGRISEDKPPKVRPLSSAEAFSVEELTYTGLFTDAPVNVRECSPSVEIGYVLVGSEPPTELVGLAGTPTYAPGVRSSFWGYLVANIRYNFPSGWVFESIDADKLAGASPLAAYVRETWQYYHDALPA